ncbi:MAG: T9SS type A sorting domain-containing protein [Bacteroidota bacterium]|nr:T9SS type A sorting domain-containing protein [Bacteroidota bacterium]
MEFISGHKITLKAYRTGTVYLLLFQTVNDSQDIFEKGGSLFAMIDFPQSTQQLTTEQSEGIKIFPNPFNDSLSTEINLPYTQNLKCEIIDLNGQLLLQNYLFRLKRTANTNPWHSLMSDLTDVIEQLTFSCCF